MCQNWFVPFNPRVGIILAPACHFPFICGMVSALNQINLTRIGLTWQLKTVCVFYTKMIWSSHILIWFVSTFPFPNIKFSSLPTVILLLPVVAWRFYKVDVYPTLTDKARLVQRSARTKHKGDTGLPRPFSGRRSRRSVRSGYAFAHSEGFGRLITSGRIMRDVGGVQQTARYKNGVGGR